MADRPTLYLIDGSSYIYRAYYAIRHLSSPKGFPTNALYGFTQMLLKVLKERKPDHVAVVFDAGRLTFRNEMYPDYKANRLAMPDDLVPQLAPIKEMVRVLKPGGRLCITDLDTHDHSWQREQMADLWLGFERDDIRKWLEDAGLIEIDVDCAEGTCNACGPDGTVKPLSIFVALGTKPA